MLSNCWRWSKNAAKLEYIYHIQFFIYFIVNCGIFLFKLSLNHLLIKNCIIIIKQSRSPFHFIHSLKGINL